MVRVIPGVVVGGGGVVVGGRVVGAKREKNTCVALMISKILIP